MMRTRIASTTRRIAKRLTHSLPTEGKVARGLVEFSWGENIKHLKREAVIHIGNQDQAGPHPYIRVRVGNEPHRWRPPHNTTIHVEIGRNRRWVIDFDALGNEFIEERVPPWTHLQTHVPQWVRDIERLIDKLGFENVGEPVDD